MHKVLQVADSVCDWTCAGPFLLIRFVCSRHVKINKNVSPRERALSLSRFLDVRYNNNNNNNRIQRRYSKFFIISSQCRELSPTRTLKWPGRNSVQITCNTSSAYHVQVSCNVPLGTKGQLSYSVWQSWNRIYLSFILLAEPLNRWRRGRNRSTRKKTLATSFRKCHILEPEDSSPKWDSNPRSSIGGRLGKQTC